MSDIHEVEAITGHRIFRGKVWFIISDKILNIFKRLFVSVYN